MKFEVKVTYPHAEVTEIEISADGKPWYKHTGHTRDGLRVTVPVADHVIDIRLDARPAYESE